MEGVTTGIVYMDLAWWCWYGIVGSALILLSDIVILERTKWMNGTTVFITTLLMAVTGYIGFAYGILGIINALLIRYANTTLAEVLDTPASRKAKQHKNGNCPTCGQRMSSVKE